MILRLLATLVWVPLCLVLLAVTMAGHVLVLAASLMIPLVKRLAEVGDGEKADDWE